MNNNGYIDSHLRALGFKCYDRKPVLSFLTATQAILASRIDPSKFCIPQKKKVYPNKVQRWSALVVVYERTL